MKRTFILVSLTLLSHFLSAQFILRNDFIIHHNKKIENRGITHITFSVGSRNVWNLNAYGQPVKAITVDMEALVTRREYTYREIAERIYRPGAVYRQSYIPIPLFLLLEPPLRRKAPSAFRLARSGD